jgi:hypothetical protein
MVAGWYDKAAVKQLRMIAVNRETTIQQQLGRALIRCSAKRACPRSLKSNAAMTAHEALARRSNRLSLGRYSLYWRGPRQRINHL